MSSSRNRTGAAALAGAAATGLIAFALFLAGGLLLWANAHYKDADGYVSTGSERFSASGYAISADDLSVGSHGPGFLFSSDRYGTIRLSARGEKPVFIGIAPTREVDTYLKDVAHSQVSDVDFAPFSASYKPFTGTQAPARPATQPFW